MAAKTALVLGAGIAGLTATAALGQAGYTVTILEADDVSEGWTARPGVPHSGQLHNILGRAQQEIEDLVPGYLAGLRESGGSFADAARDTHVVEYGVELPRRSVGEHLVCAPRPQLEGVLRDLVLAQHAPRLVKGTTVTALSFDEGHVRGAVAGAHRFGGDIVVDAMGVKSPVLAWLAEADLGRVNTEHIAVRQWYVTAVLERPHECLGSPMFWLVFPGIGGSRGGLVSPLGQDQWVVSLSGVASDAPPLTHDAMTAYAATLDSPVIADLLGKSTLKRAPMLFRKHTARWNHVEELGATVPGLLFIGDSVASLNPLLGQGISATAWQARLLRDRLMDSGSDERDVAGFTAAARADTVLPVRAALELTELHRRTVEDAAGGSIAASERMREVCLTCHEDPTLHAATVRMWHMLEDPATVLNWPSLETSGGPLTPEVPAGSSAAGDPWEVHL